MALTVRRATAGDAPAISSVRIATWRAAYADIVDASILAELDVERDAARRAETWAARHADGRVAEFVAEVDGTIVGWACGGPAVQPGLPNYGELYALYALAATWSTGVGHAMLVAVEQALRDAGYRHACLMVLEGNDRAATFYERHGWREDGTTLVDERPAGTVGVDAVAFVERRRIRDLTEPVHA